MKRWVAAVVLAMLTLTAGFLVVGLNASTSASPVVQSGSEPDDDDEPVRVAHDDRGHGPGRPSWARAAEVRGDTKGWHPTWKDLSPSQRRKTMTMLAHEHEVGMREWRRCVAADQNDCERPLPPGLAKKQLAR